MLALAVLYLSVHIVCEPYDNRAYFTLDRIEESMLAAILVTLLVQTWLYISMQAMPLTKLRTMSIIRGPETSET